MQAPNHAERAHATWSASSAKRNMTCTGALGLILEVTKDWPEKSSEAADWGTCAHEISEACLRDGSDAERFIGETLKGKEHSFVVDEEMADCAQEFIDYVRSESEAPNTKLWIEQRFHFDDLKPPFDAGGTGDAVIFKPALKELEVVDLKGGRGVVVEAKGNPQLRSYGLGAVLANPGLDVDTVKVTIVQPRARHKDGPIRSETFTVGELVLWTSEMLAAMHKAKQAMDERATITGELSEEAWAEKWLVPGDHCRDTFCPVAAVCPALRTKVEASIGLYFDPITEAPSIKNAPDVGDPAQVGKYLDAADMIEGWVSSLRAHGHRMAEMGQPPTNYVLVEKVGREKFVDAEAEKKALAAARKAGVEDSKILNAPKAKSPKQIREAMKKKKADVSALEGLSTTPTTGTNLVRQDGTIRPAVSAVEQHFEAIKE
ncbi:PD-(D/E)XK nuclease superfamily protein [Phaeobacter inhibens]|uniref:PD-(D/E)XK nuclease superfamily protein n=1 Tax=Phaeobacter inhibens TaxID=221822 RepID=A0ABN5GSJ0_9RHOB|nr:DUF2800 domain-containing protein [Phaeobacter inhibens]AUQ95989.1 PD-(D/E)XK nuclease superfamily protein [Phaeobacter inhibens]